MNVIFLTAAVAAALPAAAFSETTQDEEVFVTASRRPMVLSEVLPTADVINLEEILYSQPRDLSSLLSRVSGVSFRDSGGRGSTGGIFVRGAQPSQVLVLIDGVRVGSATTGATALENIPLETIERIEIVKGPMSGLYGSAALGGVIQVFTKKGQQGGVNGGAFNTVGSNKLHKYGASIGSGNGKHRFYLSLSKESTDGIDRTSIKDGGRDDIDGFDEISGSLSASFTLAEALQLSVNYLKSDGESDFDNTFGAEGTGFFSEHKVKVGGIHLQYSPLEKLAFTFNLGHSIDHTKTPAFFSDIETKRDSFLAQGTYYVSDSQVLVMGFDYYTDKVANFPVNERNNQALFAQYQLAFGAISLASTIRHDDNEAYGSNTNGSVFLGYNLSDSVKAVASYGTAFRAPTFNDLYFPGFGNELVLPEESESYELSFRGDHGLFTWRTSLYRSNVENLIGFDPVVFRAKNTANASLEGIELEISARLNEWQFGASADFLEARDEDTEQHLDDRAAFTLRFDIGYQVDKKLYIGADTLVENGRHDRSGTKLGGYALWGLSAVYDITNQLKLFVDMNNVFDRDYTVNLISDEHHYETDGRNAQLRIDYRL